MQQLLLPMATAAVVCTLAPSDGIAATVEDVLAAFEVRCQALRAGYFEFEETWQRPRREMPSEAAVSKQVAQRMKTVEKRDKAAGTALDHPVQARAQLLAPQTSSSAHELQVGLDFHVYVQRENLG